MSEPQLHYLFKPTEPGDPPDGVEFVPTHEFLADEPACRMLWELVDTQFHTRGKFLSIWPCVRFVAVHRDADGAVDGLCLVSAPVNWQIDYVVVRPDCRGLGIATALVRGVTARAFEHRAPYVMLTSNESLRPLYEGCGFQVIGEAGVAV